MLQISVMFVIIVTPELDCSTIPKSSQTFSKMYSKFCTCRTNAFVCSCCSLFPNVFQLCSVTEFVSLSLVIKIMTAALKHSSYVETFQFSPARELSVM